MKIVLQKFISESGYCSRRKAEELIREEKVLINGSLAKLGSRVSFNDKVEIDKKIIEIKKEKSYLKFNKPKGYTCTNRKFKNEKNIFELIKFKKGLFVAGRLDKESRGLVLLTDDGELTQKLTHPKFQHEKEYIVLIKGDELKNKNVVEKILKNFKRGVDIGEGDGIVRAKEIKYFNNKFKIILTQGKKRQIRRMFKAFDLEISDLLRIRIGNLKLDDLKEGVFIELNKEDIKNI